MKKVKDVLNVEIAMGLVNWNALSTKLHAALSMVDNKFDCIRDDGKVSQIKFRDGLTFHTKDQKVIMLIQPRFKDGELWCSGIRRGILDLRKAPAFTAPPELF